MIVIVSQHAIDFPSDYVYDWLRTLGADCVRINGADLLAGSGFSISYSPTDGALDWSGLDMHLDDVRAVWIRRWMDFDTVKKVDLGVEGLADFSTMLENYRQSEFRGLSCFFFEMLRDKPSLGNSHYIKGSLNKARQLVLARLAGLETPDTLITDSKEQVQQMMEKYDRIICKSIWEIGFFRYDGTALGTYTFLFTRQHLEELPAKFSPSLFQEALEKEFEVRVFYLDGKLYSMAIFSAGDKQTAVDFRHYNYGRPNRTVPFRLPANMEEKVIRFMELAGLDTGSLDLIFTPSGKFVFLEVNPGGQFGMVSFPCNYHLEKKVAEKLIQLASNAN